MKNQPQYYQSWLNRVQLNPELKRIVKPRLNQWIPITPTAKQAAFLWLTCKDAFYGGAGGGGKSIALLAAALQYVDRPNYTALLIRDTVKNLEMPKGLLDESFTWLTDTDAQWSDKKRCWHFPSGARLRFGYLDGPRDHFNYQGGENQFIGIDECVNIRENQAMFLFGWLRKEKGNPIPLRFRAASNPPMPEQIERGAWVKSRYIDKETKRPDAVFIPASMDDNPYLDTDTYVESLEELDPITRAKIKKGDWDIAAKGFMFQREWFEIVENAPNAVRKLRYWDLAATEKKEDNDPAFTSGVLMSVDERGIYYIEDVNRFRGSEHTVETNVRNTAIMDGHEVEMKMEQEPGSSGKIVIDYYTRKVLPGFVFSGDRPTGSKIDRARPLASQSQAGNVKIVKGRWNKAFFEELDLFPNCKYKDQVDSSSGAFSELSQGGFFRLRGIGR